MEKKINREEIFNGKVIHVVKDEVELDDGKTSYREIVYHNGGVCIALKDLEDNKFFMVKQYRYAFERELLEFCAGKIEKGEEPDSAILRECEEELGYTAKNIKKFNYVIPTCGYSSEKIYLYYGEADKKTHQNFDYDENINVYKYSFAEIKKMIQDGEIADGKTIALMYQLEIAGLND